MNTRTRNIAVGGVLAAGLLASTGCGASTSSGGGSTNQQGGTLTIATLQPLSGPFASVGQRALQGVQLAVKDINASGGVKGAGGAKLKLVTADSTSSDQTAAETVTNQLLRDNPVAVIGPSSSNVELAATTAAERAKVPICGTAYADQISQRGYKYMFQMPQTATVVGQEAVPALKKALDSIDPSIKRIAVINDDSAGVVALNESLIKAMKSSGLDVVYHQSYPLELTNAAPLAAGIKRSGAQAIVSGGQIPNIILINKALRDQGLSGLPRFNPGGGATVTPAYAKALGDSVNGEFAQNLWGYDMNLPGAQKQLLDKLNTAYTSQHDAPFTDAFVGAAYVCTQLFVAAMNDAKSSDPVDIATTLHSKEFTDGPASLWPAGKVKFNAAGVNQASVTLVGEWCDGKLQTVYPDNLAAMKPKTPAECGAPAS